jgi:MFS family permease
MVSSTVSRSGVSGKRAGTQASERLYSFLVEEEDARVCTDIPEESCTDVPGNFVRLGLAQTLTKLADELSSAKTVLPWVLTSLGAPAFWIGFLVPIRESGSLLPQMAIASAVRRKPRRKEIWILGGMLQAAALMLIAVAALGLSGNAAAVAIVGLLALASLARGLCSVASKDVVGKTIPKTRRGRLAGFTTLTAGLATLTLGAVLGISTGSAVPALLLAAILGAAALLWLGASAVFSRVQEEPGATEGGGNALEEALRRLDLLRTDGAFRRFVLVRALLVATALTAPFYVALARENDSSGGILALFILASGMAAALSGPFWGRFADRSSRKVLTVAASVGAILGFVVFGLAAIDLLGRLPWIVPLAFFLLTIAHSGIRIGRKTYILDLASGNRRTDYVAVSNTVIGVVLLCGGLLALAAAAVGPAGMILVLSCFGVAGALGSRTLPEVQ